jgi:phosphinothricin acetyltransferase
MLRLASPSDASAILSIYAPIVRETTISFELEPPPVEEMAARIASTEDRHPWLVCEIGGAVAGYAYASPFRTRPAYRSTAEVSVYVAPAYRGRRVAMALYEALLGLLSLQRFHTAVAVIALPNAASLALHRRLGFRHAGTLEEVGLKHGRRVGIDLWQLRLGAGAAGDPLAVGMATRDPAWREVLDRAALRIVAGGSPGA